MISYHNPLTKQQIDIYPVLEGNTLRHAIHKRSKNSEEEMKFFSFAESALKEKSRKINYA
jgi:glycine betaine/choline ABC-type transport system substrate-binding protein